MRINTNIAALNSYNQLTSTNKSMEKSLSRLSSGKRINSAADDAAGLAISEKMKGQVSGMAKAQRNSQDGISLIQTAEGALQETQSMLQRMRELSVQSANDTNTDEDRAELQKEVEQLSEQIDDIAKDTEFNTKTLMTGGYSSDGLKFQVGANEDQTIELTLDDMTASGLEVVAGSGEDIDIATQSDAESAIETIDGALSGVSSERASLGATQNRLDHINNNLGVSEENLTAANSRIEDVDMSREMMSFTKSQILQQGGTAMMAQANQMPQGVLQLLG
ncbi:MAG: flagellin [Bacillota bacterium]